MPGLGFAEVLFIFVAALLLFGPRRLPEIGRTLGKGLAEFRKASNELKRSLDAEGLEEDLRQTREAIASVDPRRYLSEAMADDTKSGRVARSLRAPPVKKADEEPVAPASDAPPPGAEGAEDEAAPAAVARDEASPRTETPGEPAAADS